MISRGALKKTSLWTNSIGDCYPWASPGRMKCKKCALHCSWEECSLLEPLAERVDTRSTPSFLESEDTEGMRPATLQLKKRNWWYMLGFRLFHKWLVLKQSSSWHIDCVLGWMFKRWSPSHTMQSMLHGVSGSYVTDHTIVQRSWKR